MKVLIILNREPYDNTDVTWNRLRLADKLAAGSNEVRLLLMNDAVDLARDACSPPEGYDQDLSKMLKALIASGATVRVCGTCMTRCGIYKNQPYFEGAEKLNMQALADWVVDSDKVISFWSAHRRSLSMSGHALLTVTSSSSENAVESAFGFSSRDRDRKGPHSSDRMKRCKKLRDG